jgi:hypothetical protein
MKACRIDLKTWLVNGKWREREKQRKEERENPYDHVMTDITPS